MAEKKLVRCMCGEVFDFSGHQVCPACGEAPKTEEPLSKKQARAKKQLDAKKRAAQAQQATVVKKKQGSALPQGTFKKTAVLAGVILLLAFVVSAANNFIEGKKAERERKEESLIPESEGSPELPSGRLQPPKPQQQQQQQQKHPVLPPPTKSNSRPAIDAALMGSWQLRFQRDYWNYETWTITFKQGGAPNMLFRSSDPYKTPGYDATFTANDGKYQLLVPSSNWKDEGTYQFVGQNQMVMSGKNGTGTWYRMGTLPPVQNASGQNQGGGQTYSDMLRKMGITRR